MRVWAVRHRPSIVLASLALVWLAAAGFLANGYAAEADTTPPPKETFNLILPFKNLTVGQGQEVTMDTEIVNRRKDPVEISLTLGFRAQGMGCHLQFPLSELSDPLGTGPGRKVDHR